MPIKMPGFMLYSTLESLHCFILMDWKFTLRILEGGGWAGGGALSFVCRAWCWCAQGGFLLGVDV